MTNSAGLIDYLLESLAPPGGVSARRMFGGHGLFRRSLMFALVAGDTLYLKADEDTIPAFQAAGCGLFFYTRNSRQVALGYWQVPAAVLDEPEELRAWAERAFAVALRSGRVKAAR
jgi:DNA transformation protein and related proteins